MSRLLNFFLCSVRFFAEINKNVNCAGSEWGFIFVDLSFGINVGLYALSSILLHIKLLRSTFDRNFKHLY